MLIRTNKPGKDFIYPCSKSDLRRVFGDDLLHHCSFRQDYLFDRRIKYPDISGVVLAYATTDSALGAYVSLFRTIKGFYCPGQRDHFVRVLESEMRPWIESKLARTENQFDGREELMIEFVGGGFKLHSVKYNLGP